MLRGWSGPQDIATAARAGVHRTTIFRCWPTKAALVRAAFERVTQAVDFDWDAGSLRGDLEVFVERTGTTMAAPAMLGLLRVMLGARTEPVLRELAATAEAAKLGAVLMTASRRPPDLRAAARRACTPRYRRAASPARRARPSSAPLRPHGRPSTRPGARRGDRHRHQGGMRDERGELLSAAILSAVGLAAVTGPSSPASRRLRAVVGHRGTRGAS